MLITTLKRVAAGTAGTALALTGATVFVAPAYAADVTSDYVCTNPLAPSDPTQDIAMKVTSSAMSEKPGQITLTNKVTVPANFAGLMKSAFDSVDVTASAPVSFNGTSRDVALVAPKIKTSALNPDGSITLNATGTTSVDLAQTVVVADGIFGANINVYDTAGNASPLATTCQTADGSKPNLGTVDARTKTSTALTLDKATASVGDVVTATAKVTGATDGSVDFVVAGKTTNVKLASGAATFTVPTTAAGAVDVAASYVPADAKTVAPSTATAAKVTVAKVKTATTVTFNPATAVVGDAVNAVAKVADAAGKPVAGSVDFVVGGVTTNVALDATGSATLALPKPTAGGPVAVTVNAKPTDLTKYETSTITGSMTVGVAATTTKGMAKKVQKFGKTTKVMGMVSTANGAVVSGKATVVVKMGKKTAGKASGTVTNGKVAFKVKKLKKGKYTAVVSYSGLSGSFSASTAKAVKFTIK